MEASDLMLSRHFFAIHQHIRFGIPSRFEFSVFPPKKKPNLKKWKRMKVSSGQAPNVLFIKQSRKSSHDFFFIHFRFVYAFHWGKK